ncbi:MAG TPA: peptide MFS transporter [Steroidobacteraceae bacterium]|jgi:POT family proton-dependent oligopeptide transporter|nr:peptide MFS transporter [Steroidobacteraceae bacterium]
MLSDVDMRSSGLRAGTFLGEPKALGYLAFTEAWERFSFYGMSALLVLYLTQALLLPGHVEHVQGFAAFRAGLERLFGPLSTVALASQIYGLYSGFVYFTPVLGGWLADRWLGTRNAVVIGALLMSAGHVAMVFDQSLLLALVLLIVGCGLLKGNISNQVGTLYREEDAAGRTRGFTIFSFGINAGSVLGPLVCGWLAESYGWHAGFGAAGALMLVGLATYLVGYSSYTHSVRTSRPEAAVPRLDSAQWRVTVALLVAIALTLFQTIAYYQNSDAAMVWIDRDVNLRVFGFLVPVAWFNSIDPLVSMAAVPFLLAYWRSQASRGREPSEVGKIGIGAWMASAANLLLVLGCVLWHRVPMWVPFLYDTVLGLAFLYYWPPLLALVSREAPPRLRATLMGSVFLSLFFGNLAIGWLGALYERVTPAQFWALHAGIAAVGGLLVMVLQRPLARTFGAAGGKVSSSAAS